MALVKLLKLNILVMCLKTRTASELKLLLWDKKCVMTL